jgi:hypothetical protein
MPTSSSVLFLLFLYCVVYFICICIFIHVVQRELPVQLVWHLDDDEGERGKWLVQRALLIGPRSLGADPCTSRSELRDFVLYQQRLHLILSPRTSRPLLPDNSFLERGSYQILNYELKCAGI